MTSQKITPPTATEPMRKRRPATRRRMGGFLRGCAMNTINIGPPLTAGEREISVVRRGRRAVAYGYVAADGETYRLLHAPTQKDFDAVAAALDRARPADIRLA